MTAPDTNVLVRILTNDDADQSQRATAFMRSQERVYLLKTVLLEVEWVLRSAYGFDRDAILFGLRELMKAPNLELEDGAAVIRGLQWFEQGMDFADALHLASTVGDVEFATFDRSLVSTAEKTRNRTSSRYLIDSMSRYATF
jgi:predicted nucleic-acid-binding protein